MSADSDARTSDGTEAGKNHDKRNGILCNGNKSAEKKNKDGKQNEGKRRIKPQVRKIRRNNKRRKSRRQNAEYDRAGKIKDDDENEPAAEKTLLVRKKIHIRSPLKAMNGPIRI